MRMTIAESKVSQPQRRSTSRFRLILIRAYWRKARKLHGKKSPTSWSHVRKHYRKQKVKS